MPRSKATPLKKRAKVKQAPRRTPRTAAVRVESVPTEHVDIGKLLDADVLLYHGTSWLAKAIRFFDGTDVNHASIVIGVTPPEVGEALSHGLTKNSVPASIHDSPWVLARRLKDRPSNVSPVIARADYYLSRGQRYGYEQLLLLAFLSILRKPKITPIFKKLVLAVLERAASLLLKLSAGGREPMICSEFVYRCYEEALPTAVDIFSLRIERAVSPEGIRKPGAKVRVDRVHPDSVLAVVLRQPLLRATATPEAAPAPLPPLLQRYLAEAVAPGLESVKTAEVVDAELSQAVARFAASWHLAKVEKESKLRPESVAPEDALTSFYQTVSADFVTPGDLLKTESLLTLGVVQ